MDWRAFVKRYPKTKEEYTALKGRWFWFQDEEEDCPAPYSVVKITQLNYSSWDRCGHPKHAHVLLDAPWYGAYLRELTEISDKLARLLI